MGMTSTAATAVVRRYVEEVHNQRHLAAVDDLVALIAVDHSPMPGQAPGRAGFVQFVTANWATFPDLQYTIEQLVTEGDLVFGRFTFRGTQHGPFLGLPPTHKPIQGTSMALLRVAQGQIVERWAIADLLGVAQQLGAVLAPTPQEA
jgi:steroid delta-isomerase-like uncharacterized protein